MNGEGKLTSKIVEQIMTIRESGQANMLDTLHVQNIANDMRFYELMLFIEDNKQAFAEFILYGRTTQVQKAHFMRKAVNLAELMRASQDDRYKEPFVIEKTVELEKAQYVEFTENLLDDYDFIKENLPLMCTDAGGIRHCILVKEIGADSGVLSESSGYPYSRYSGIYTG
ncbi:MAG: DUF5049 domain-containing protein [Saccharofermentanales bacterium]